MKLKATISMPFSWFREDQRYALADLVVATNSLAIWEICYDDVKVKHLKVPARGTEKEWGPGVDFVQITDRSIPSSPWGIIGVDVTLSGVSVTSRRAHDDFWDALDTLLSIYASIIKIHLLKDMKAELYVRMALDAPITVREGRGQTPLIEIGPVTIEGERSFHSPPVSEQELLAIELEALLGSSSTAKLLLSQLSIPSGVS